MPEISTSKVLILEPDYLLSKIYLDFFSNEEFDVEIANNAQKAINIVDRIIPDLIVVEIQLTDHSGVEFLYELRSYKDLQQVPVIIYSVIPACEFKDSMEIFLRDLNVSLYLEKETNTLQDLADELNKFLRIT